MENVRKFGIKDKIGYMCGDIGNDFFFALVGSFLTIFYTNVLGISGAIVGTLFLTARCVDAFTDIGMGRIVDICKPTKEGRYRPWIRRMRLPVVLAGLLLFIPWVKDLPMGIKIVYIFATYILWGSICYTGINIPYGSMASAITDDSGERTSLSSARSVGASLAAALVGFITPMIIYVKDSEGNNVASGGRFFILAFVFAILAFISYTICYHWTCERISIAPEKKEGTRRSAGEFIKSLVTNRALISLIAAAIILLLASMLTGTMNTYLFQDYFKSPAAMSVAGAFTTLCTLVLAPFASRITKRFGKKEASSVALLFAAVIYAFLFIARLENPWVFCAFIFFGNMGSGMFNLMIWAFIADIIDYQIVTTGSSDGGTVYGIYSFARKLGQALAGGLGGFTISLIGYQSSTGGAAIQQTEEVTSAIYSVATGVPAAGYLIIALILIFWYPLSAKKLEEIRKKKESMQ